MPKLVNTHTAPGEDDEARDTLGDLPNADDHEPVKRMLSVQEQAGAAFMLAQKMGALRKRAPPNAIPHYGSELALMCIPPSNGFRRRMLAIAESPIFETVILIFIMLNCVALAAYDPTVDDDEHSSRNDFLENLEYAFLAIFTIEMIVKIFAFGFMLDPGTYIRNWWNVLDFLIVATGWLSVISEQSGGGSGADVKALRALRVLRSLRVIQGLPSLQLVLNSILASIPRLIHVAILTAAIILLYALIGVEFFSGGLNKQCFYNATAEPVEDERPCVFSGSGHHCVPDVQYCGPSPGPNNGISTFDHMGVAMLTVFQCLTLEGWTDVLYNVQDAYGGATPWIYFVTLVILGSFFVLNLVLGVISGEFTKEGQRVERQKDFHASLKQQTTASCVADYTEWIDTADDPQKLQTVMERGEEEPETVEVTNMFFPKRHKHKKRVKIDTENCPHPEIAVFVQSKTFVMIVMIVVFINTVFLAIDHAGQSQSLDDTLRIGNFVFLGIFTAELLFKLWALGPRNYILSKFNIFDAVVVFLSLLELILVEGADQKPIGFSVLRCIRLLRLFKLTKYWAPLSALTDRLMENLGSILSLLGLLQLLILVFALLGMQIFGGKFDPEERSNFDDFWKSYITVFQMLTGEDWNEVMYAAINSYGGIDTAGSLACLYFVALVVIGNYVVLNIFLAIAVDSLEALQESIEEVAEEEREEEARKRQSLEPTIMPGGLNDPKEANEGYLAINVDENDADGLKPPKNPQPYSLAGLKGEVNPEPEVDKSVPDHYSFYLFSPTLSARIAVNKLIWIPYFDHFILTCIIISSGLMAAEDPVNPDSQRNNILNYFDFVFTSIFAVEMLLKMFALGLIKHNRAYMRSAWNLLDMLVVISSVISLALAGSGVDVSAVRVLRVLRVLRPLRAINRAERLKQVVQCLVTSVMNIGSILLLTLLAIFLFAVMGVQLFKGGFRTCTDDAPEFNSEATCVGFFNTTDFVTGLPVAEERRWVDEDFNFNNVANGMSTLFAAATTEGWPGTLFFSIDATGENQGPEENYRPAVALYYIFYMIVLAFFLLNLFIGYVIVTFRDTVEEQFQDCPFDKSQRSCIAYCLEAHPKKLHRWKNPNKLLRICYKIVDDVRFEYFIMVVIALNIVVLAMKYDGMSENYEHGLYIANVVFTIIFTIEAVLKIAGLSFKGYFYDAWNVFDFIIVVGSLLDAGFEGQGVNINFLRIFRAARLIKLLKKGGIQRLLWTFVRSFKSLPWVALLIAMVFFVYGVVGMQVFGRVELHPDRPINTNTNFRTLPQALSLLVRSATGESWQTLMEGCMLSPPDCDPDHPDGSTCGNEFAIPYFISFICLCSFLIVNLFVAVIVDNFDYLTEDRSKLGAHHLDEFTQVWSKYDPSASERLKYDDFEMLLRAIDPPLGLGKHCPVAVMHHILMRLDAPMRMDGTIEFKSALTALVRLRLKIKPKEHPQLLAAVHLWFPAATKEDIAACFPDPTKECGHTELCSCLWSIRFLYTVLRLQYLFRKNKKLAKSKSHFSSSSTKFNSTSALLMS
eukprot:m.210181 g.210181  ORF g.210181 m.210181 type:complete len:1539 (-) comp26120_c1_seq2:53-4669(-)